MSHRRPNDTNSSGYGTPGKWRRAVAVLLTGVLTFEAAFGNGISVAVAEGLGNGASQDTQMVLGQTGEGDSLLPADVRSASFLMPGDGSANMDEGTNASDADDESETGDNGASSSQGGLEDSGTDDGSGALDAVDETTGDDGAAADDSDAAQSWDWTDKTRNLTLGSTGFELDEDALREAVTSSIEAEQGDGTQEGDSESAATDSGTEAPDQGSAVDAEKDEVLEEGSENSAGGMANDETAAGSVSLLSEGAEGAGEPDSEETTAADVLRRHLPQTLAGTLDLSFSLDPAADDAGDEGHAAIVPGDWFTVNLPEGFTLSDEMLAESEQTFDIFQSDEQGNPTTLKIAEGSIEGDGTTLRVTFVDPVDTAGAGGDDDVATQGEDEQLPDTRAAKLALRVSMGSSLLDDDGSSVEWALQTASGDEAEKATISLPGLTALAGDLDITAPSSGHEDTGKNEDANGEEGEGEEGNEDGSAQNEDPLDSDAEPEKTVTYSLNGFDGSDSMTITWCDNNSSSRPTPASYGSAILPMFSVNDGEWIALLTPDGNLTETAKAALHIDDASVPVWAKPASVTRSSVSDWIASVSGLPTKLTTTTKTPTGEYGDDGKLIYDTATTDQTIEWKLQDTNDLPEGYVYGENDSGKDGDHRYLMSTTEVSFTVIGKIGDQTLPDTFQDDQAKDFVFKASIDGEEVEGSPTIADLVKNGTLKLVTSEDSNTCTISGELPMYDYDGNPIVYYIEYVGESESNDYYQATYDNSASPSHGSATNALYDGGTMTLRHVGNTTFKATKEWLDGGNQENRPATTFTLWRYANNGTAGATTASQVQLTNDMTDVLEYATINLDAGGDEEVDLGALLAKTYGADAMSSLPKYDPDGYPYVYALREESAPAGYEIVYGSVGEDGTVTDTAPNYYEANGNQVFLKGEDRPSTDPLIYNGGTVTNRLTGTVQVSSTKTWEIAAFQDDLADVVVTFTAQSRVKGSSDDWEDVTGANATHTETEWKSETLTRSFSGIFSKYNALGQELEYRWVESDVTLGDQQTGFTFDDETGTGSFTLTLSSPDDEGGETLEFTSTYEPAEPSDGTFAGTITNTFSNVTDQHVDKYWEQPDGTLAQIKPVGDSYPDNLDMSGNVTFDVFRDGALVGTFTLDGTKDAGPTQLTRDGSQVAEGMSGVTYQETRSYHADILNLPKYAPDGSRYSYLVLEQNPSGWHTERTYDEETRTTRVENTYGPGEGSEIRVMKDWVDGDDAAHRLQVVVKLVALHDMQSEAKGADGNPLYSYKKGEVVDVFGKGGSSTGAVDEEEDTITLSAAGSWYAEVDVPIGGLTYEDFKLVEVALTDGTNTYPVVATAEEAADKYGEDAESWSSVGWDYESTMETSRVATPDHVYEVSAGETDEATHNDDMKAVTASNRRIGILDLKATKTWKDGGDKDARPDAELVLSCVEYPDGAQEGGYGFSIDNDGKVWIQVSDNRLPVLDSNRAQLTTGSVRLEDGALVVKVDNMVYDEESDTYTFGFYGLPKYDANGSVVHYDVSERWTVTGPSNYASAKSVGEYVVGDRHFHDEQTFSFTNTRQGSRNVTFYKHWNDQYVNEDLSQRPDIFLTLYRVTKSVDANGRTVYSAPEQVEGYVKYLWEGTTDPEGGDSRYDQVCTIDSLPKYDSEGREYVYYASESMAADGTALDYAPVKFDYEGLDGVEEDYAVKVDKGAQDANPTQDGSAYALHEDGTFVNMLKSELEANGVKLWSNVPGNVVQSEIDNDLPEVTIYLQRRVAGETEWPELRFTVDEDGKWAFAKNGKGAVAWTSNLTYVTNNQYTYTLTHLDENGPDPESEPGDPLERYTPDGKLYEYRAVEVVWGLMNTPGGFTEGQIENVDVASQEGEQTSVEGVFVIEHGETGSFRINNVYQSDKGNLTVRKHFADRAEGDLYPATTFDVYRFYETKDGQSSEAELVYSKPFSSEEIKEAVGENAGGNGTFTHTFEGLDIYAPNGNCWQYYVVERTINGYETTVGLGNLEANSDTLVKGELMDGGMRSKTLGTSDESEVKRDDETVDVTFKNEYDPDTANLTGTKTWDDYNNIFGLRPTVDQFKANLKVERIGNGGTVDITDHLQNTDSYALYYYTITESEPGPNIYVITINNVEKWAPDGTSYQYRVTENLSELLLADNKTAADDYYQATVGPSSTVTASSTNSQFRLNNALKGQATVSKAWNDGDDPYGLRPSSVTVRLQARINGSDDNEWNDAYDLLKTLASEESLTENGLGSNTFTKTLSENNGWKSSWTNLPYAAMQNGNLVTIQYRVVETAIGEQDVTPPIADAPEQGASNIYGDYHPYQPSQETEIEDKTSATTITNTLGDTTQISATKTWSDDKDDAWGTRPGGGTTWSVTYLLQRRLESKQDTDWQWLMEYGAAQATTPLDESIVSKTITGDGKSGTATWNHLPACNENGCNYEYRVVEQVPGSYDVEGTPVATATDENGVAYRYYVVPSKHGDDGFDIQSFTNNLRTVDLTGTKLWEDFDAGLVDNLTKGDMPTMVLWRQAKGGTAEQVKMKDGSAPAQPEWTEGAVGWTFTYTNLPAADENDKPYTYWAEEQQGSAPGFYPVYDTADAAGTDAEGDAQWGTTITNYATKLTLDKVSDFEGEQLTSIELTVTSVDGKLAYAVWERNQVDDVTTWVLPKGGFKDEVEQDANKMTGDAAGYIIGLPAGEYKVVETGSVPEGYAKAEDVNFTINANGTAAAAANVTTTTEDGVHTINVTVTDPVLRGHLQLTKKVSEDGTYDAADATALQGAKFDLYRVDMDNDGVDELIASDLTTNAQGVITTVGNSARIIATGTNGGDLTYGGKYTMLSDGLPEGKYYFVETDATPGAVMPSGDAAKTDSMMIAQKDHYAQTQAPVSVTRGNEDFSATVVLKKYDTVTSDGIKGAEFKLSYTLEGSDVPAWRLVTTDDEGTLTLSGLEKGSYTLTETSNQGYETPTFSATFTIENEDDDRTFNIENVKDGEDINFKVTSSPDTFVDGKGVPNTPLRGSVSMCKTGMNNTALNGVTFELQRKDGDTWTTIAENLVTGNTYKMNDDNNALDGTGAAGNAGGITVSNLLWGEYRFVETEPAPGYVGVTDDYQPVTSSSVKIDRTNVSNAVSVDTVKNEPTHLEINKVSDADQPLEGAEFTVTPVGGSTFADGTTGAKTITSNSTGLASLDGWLVVDGTYTIYESKAPVGYDPVDGKLTVMVEKDGSLKPVGDLPSGWTRTAYPGGEQNQFSFTATNTHLAIELVKVSAKDHSVKVEGAEFTLSGECMDGNTTHVYETNENGVIEIDDGLMEGVSYTLTETQTPAGYVTMDPLTFQINTRGEIEVTGNAPEGWSIGTDKISIVAADTPVELQITKVSPDGTPLKGATFQITPAEGTGTTFAHGERALALETGEDGTAASTAELVVGGTYDITELVAPEGYEKVVGTMRVTVDKDGSINVIGRVENGTFTEGPAPTGYEKVTDNAFEVKVTNEPIDITIEKVGTGDYGTGLNGAVFEVTGVFAGGTESETRTFTTGTRGELLGQVNLSAVLKSEEFYALKEVTAPAGYELVEGTLSFKVHEDGTMSSIGEVPAGYLIDTNGVSIVVADSPIEVSLSKGGESGEPLAGAVFEIAPASGTFPDGEAKKTFTSDASGSLVDDLQLAGSAEGTRYVVTEVEAPAGYQTLPAFAILVFEDGTVQLADDAPDAVKELVTISSEGGVTIAMRDRLTPPPTPTNPSEPSTPPVSKSLTGRDMVAGEFSFTITANEDYDTVVSPKTVMGTNDASGNVAFDQSFIFTKEGDYDFTIREVLPQDDEPETPGTQHNGVTYDETSFSATAHVEKRGSDLVVTWTVTGGAAAFHNDYESSESAEVALGVRKVLEGRDIVAGEFTFELRDEAGNVVATATNGADGLVSFPSLTFDEAGEHHYTISEVAGGEEGMTYDSSVHAVTVTVVENADGTLTATVTYDGSGALPTFTNVFEPGEPEEPDNPSEPDEPDEPDEPGTPSEPDEPGTPVAPDEPGKPDEPVSPEVPETGDHTNAALPVLLGTTGAALLVGAVALKKRRNEDR